MDADSENKKCLALDKLSHHQRFAVDSLLGGGNVVVKAVAGAGKTRTALTAAAELLKASPRDDLCAIVISYNKRLRAETGQLVHEGVPEGVRSRILVHTYYSLSALCFGVGPKDGKLDEESEYEHSLKSVAQRGVALRPGALGGDGKPRQIALVVIDEAQDMTPTHYLFVQHLLLRILVDRRLPAMRASALAEDVPPQMLLVGDACQLVYSYRGASINFMAEPQESFARMHDGHPLIAPSPFQMCHLPESFRVSPEIAEWINKHLSPTQLALQFPDWAAGVGRPWVDWWRQGIVGRAPSTPPVVELHWKRPDAVQSPETRGAAAKRHRVWLERFASSHTESPPDADELARRLDNVDPLVLRTVMNLVDELGASNVAVLALSVKQNFSQAVNLERALPVPCSRTVNGKRLSEGDLVVNSITSFKGLERDAIVLLNFDDTWERMYRDDPGSLLNQYYVAATRARKRLVVVKDAGRPAFATLRPTSFFTRESLSDEQREVLEAVVSHRLNVVVNACAGSGKTRTALTCAGDFVMSRLRATQQTSLDSDASDSDAMIVPDPSQFNPTPDARANKDAGSIHSTYDVIIVAYNKRLEQDMTNQAANRLPAETRWRIRTSTIHSLANVYFDSTAWDDDSLRRVVREQIPLRVAAPPVGLVIVDESQDLSETLVKFLRYFLSRLNARPQMLVLGDAFQRIYPGAKLEFFNNPSQTWATDTGTPLYKHRKRDECSWYFMRLSCSFRITPAMAEFINRELSPHSLARIPQYQQFYEDRKEYFEQVWGDGIRSACTNSANVNDGSVTFIRGAVMQTIAASVQAAWETYAEEDSILMASSIDNDRTPVRILMSLDCFNKENFALLSSKSRNTDNAIVENPGLAANRDNHKHKRLVSTIHQMKGLEVKLAILFGFDGFVERRPNPDIQQYFNMFYVALTRASERLIVVQYDKTPFATTLERLSTKERVLAPPKTKAVPASLPVTDLVKSVGPTHVHLVDHESPDGPFSVVALCRSRSQVSFTVPDVHVPGRANRGGNPTVEDISSFLGVALEVRLEAELNHGRLTLPDPYEGSNRHFAAELRTKANAVKSISYSGADWEQFMPVALLRHCNEQRTDYLWRQQREFRFIPTDAVTQKMTTAYHHLVRLLYAAFAAVEDPCRQQVFDSVTFGTAMAALTRLRDCGRLRLQYGMWAPVAEPPEFRQRVAGGIIGLADYVLLPEGHSAAEAPADSTSSDLGDIDMFDHQRTVIVELKLTRSMLPQHRLQCALYRVLFRQGLHLGLHPQFAATIDPSATRPTPQTVQPDFNGGHVDAFMLYATGTLLKLEERRADAAFLRDLAEVRTNSSNSLSSSENAPGTLPPTYKHNQTQI